MVSAKLGTTHINAHRGLKYEPKSRQLILKNVFRLQFLNQGFLSSDKRMKLPVCYSMASSELPSVSKMISCIV